MGWKSFNLTPQWLALDPQRIDARLRAHITRWEWLALGLNLLVMAGFLLLQPPAFRSDLEIYLRTARGQMLDYYYADWLLPLFALLDRLPHVWVYVFWSLAGLAAVLFAARVFGGSAPLALASYQMVYVLYHGQITVLLVGALALMWWALAHRRWALAGMCLLIAGAKFQLGLPIGLGLLLLADVTWKERLRVLAVPAALGLLSLVVYPWWPLRLVERIQMHHPNADGSLAPWRWIGPAALLVWLPPFLLPIAKEKRLLALIAASALGLPYFQQADLLALFVLPVSWLPLLGNAGLLQFVLGYSALQALALIPLGVYLGVILPAGWGWWAARQRGRAAARQLDTRPRPPE